jgi:hypothetical protein
MIPKGWHYSQGLVWDDAGGEIVAKAYHEPECRIEEGG